MAFSPARNDTEEAFLDAAERLLVTVGYAGVSARRLAEEAGANHGLVHYYFGSMEELFLRVLERFTGRLIERQQAMYSADGPFIEKWRTAMRYLEEDIDAGYPKVWLELQAMAWNHPDMGERVARVNAEWRAVLNDAFAAAAQEYGLDPERFPVGAMVSLVMTFNEGIMLERMSGVSQGHGELLGAIDGWLARPRAGKGGTGMRARLPDQDGYVERDGVKIFYEVFGDGEPTILLLPTWSIVHARHWKAQVPYLSRHFRVVTFDGRGNGRSDSPEGADAYSPMRVRARTRWRSWTRPGPTRRCSSRSRWARNWALVLAAFHPERVAGAAFIGPPHPSGRRTSSGRSTRFDEELDTDEGWAKYNRHYWHARLPRLRRLLLLDSASPSRTRPSRSRTALAGAWRPRPRRSSLTIEGMEAGTARRSASPGPPLRAGALPGAGRSPATGTPSRPTPRAIELAERTNGTLVTLEGAGHLPHVA